MTNILPASQLLGQSALRERENLRIAIMSTPRTGNTWLRRLLEGIYALPQIVADTPDDVNWEQLPQQCILQLHWPADTELQSRLASHRFKVVTLFRHPCDTLISILHFATVWENTKLWMGGMQGDEAEIVGARPCSREFVKYVASDRAKTLIAASANWAATENCLRVGYEALVQDTPGELARLTQQLCPATAETIAQAVEGNSIHRMRSSVQNQHCWRGQPGTWRQLLPWAAAEEIVKQHRFAFEAMGYSNDADRELTTAEADANWTTMELVAMRQEVAETRSQLKRATDELNEARWKLIALEEKLDPLVEHVPTLARMARRAKRIARPYREAIAFTKRRLGIQDRSDAA